MSAPQGYHYEPMLVRDERIGRDAVFSEWIDALDILKAFVLSRWFGWAVFLTTGIVVGQLAL